MAQTWAVQGDNVNTSIIHLYSTTVTWVERYFSKQCDIMPTTGRNHISNNFTRREVFKAYKDDMLLDIVHFIQYRHFNRLWRSLFNNVVIPRKVRMGVCSVCANLRRMAKSGRTDVEIKNYRWHGSKENMFATFSKITKGYCRWMPCTNALSSLFVILANNQAFIFYNLSSYPQWS